MGEGREVLWESGAGSGHGNATWTEEATPSLCPPIRHLSRRSVLARGPHQALTRDG
jgi:hypothetical protein